MYTIILVQNMGARRGRQVYAPAPPPSWKIHSKFFRNLVGIFATFSSMEGLFSQGGGLFATFSSYGGSFWACPSPYENFCGRPWSRNHMQHVLLTLIFGNQKFMETYKDGNKKSCFNKNAVDVKSWML